MTMADSEMLFVLYPLVLSVLLECLTYPIYIPVAAQSPNGLVASLEAEAYRLSN